MHLTITTSSTLLHALRRPVSALQQRVVDALFEAGAVMTRRELVDRVYGHQSNGGPLNAEYMIAVSILRLRKRGFPIWSIGHRGYMLRPGAPWKRQGAKRGPRSVHDIQEAA